MHPQRQSGLARTFHTCRGRRKESLPRGASAKRTPHVVPYKPSPVQTLRSLTLLLLLLAVRVHSQTADAFHPDLTANSSPGPFVAALAIQPDGEVLVGGSFNGPTGLQPFNIAQYYPDGTDTGFAYGIYHNYAPGSSSPAGASAAAMAVQTNGGFLVAGIFDNVSGYPREGLARFGPDLTLDLNFNPGASNGVACLALQPDGGILVGGAFTNLAGQARSHIGRLLPSGVLDTNFNPGADSSVTCLALQPDGKILVGGTFLTLAGQPCHMLGRLNADGSLDATFNPSPNGAPNAIILQPDGRIIVGGNFSMLAGATRNYLGRLNAGGTIDTNFIPDAQASFVVNSLALQTDGRIIAGGGGQQTTNCLPLNPLARLNTNGTADFTFNPCATMTNVLSLALQKDGALMVGGNLTTLAGQPRTAVGRLNNTSQAAESLSFNNSSVTWLRSGTSTEIWRATFDYSPDGASWIPLGAATRISGGWQLTGLAIPTTNSIVRARGFVVGGNWFIETIVGLPVLTSQPLSLTNNATTTAMFSITGYGGLPLSYQWLKNGGLLSDGGKISGAQTPTLTLSNVLGADAGAYRIVLSNASGSVTSSVANLTVLDPVFTSQPVGQSRVAGQNVSFSVFAVGTSPLGFQWLLHGTNLSDFGNVVGSQSTNLVMTNLTGINAGNFQAVASNVWGSVTSSVAILTVADPWIYTNPVNRSVQGGQSVTLGVLAAGNPPLAYQWFKNATPVNGANNASLTFPSIQGFDAGSYNVIVSDSFGSSTSALATVTVADPFISSNPTNQFLQAGQTAYLAVTAGGGSPVTYQWFRNSSPVQGATNASLIYANAQSTNAGYFNVVVSDAFGSVTSAVAAVTINAAMADNFIVSGAGAISVLALQPDGKILFAGPTTQYGNKGAPGPLRFNADGSPDPTFVPGVTNPSPYGMVVQPDGKIVVCGTATYAQRTVYLWRLDNNGSVDGTFTNRLGSGPNGTVYCLAPQADGKLILGGSFSSVSGQTHQDIARLNSDGSLDTNFNASVSGPVYSLAVQPDGAIVVGGTFNTVDGQPRNYLGRLHSEGSLDTGFTASANSVVYCLAVQADNRILVGGAFTSLNGQARNEIARLNTNGTIDATFNPNANYLVYSMIPQTDGRIVIGGRFTTVGGLSRNYIARLNSDGSLDLSFNPGASGVFIGSDPGVYALALPSDGAILAGGQFTSLGGMARTNIGRLINTEPATQSLAYTSTNVTWLRGGTSPEIWRATFESSGDGLNWTNLGVVQRITGGWQLSGLILPTLRNVRARGFLAGGQSDASAYFVQSVLGPPTLDTQPLSRTNIVTSTATFFVVSSGDLPLNYQWLKGGSPLANGGKVSGAATAVLTMSNVFGSEIGGYSVVVSNSSGSITSSVANLTVIEPLITAQPTNQFANAGDTVSFSVSAAGSNPINYQWRKGGTNIPSANSAILTLPNISRVDIATYSVLVSTPYGSALSSNAALMVNLAVPDSFNPGAGDEVRLLVPQTDGKILVGYSGTTNGGVSATPLVRLNTNGSVDTAFNPSPNSWLYCMTVQTNGQIIVGGTFQTIAGQIQPCVARLNPDGTLDGSFRPGITLFEGIFQPGLYSLALQPDGKILAGGFFDSLAGGTSSNLCRLNVDGSNDTTFFCTLDREVRTIALQSDGQIIIGGDFTSVNGQPHNHIARLAANGSPDPTFNPGTDNHVYCLIIQPDGRILVAGQFTTLTGISHANLGRLNTDGSLDAGFTAMANNIVESLALQADGRIIVGGFFSSVAGVTRNSLGRLNSDGSPDTTFFPALSGFTSNVFTPEIQCCTIQPDGSLLLGGAFTAINGQPRASLARLAPTEPAGQYLSSDGLSITWLRGGTTPEIWRATFETSPDGTNWTMAGPGARVAGGWQLTGLSLTRNELVRARGFTSGDYYQGSCWFMESIAHVLAPPTLVANDATFGLHSNQFTFNVSAVPGQAVVIEASSNFVNWVPVQTNLLMSGTIVPPANAGLFNFTDPQAALYPHRFYRARLYQGPLPAPGFGGGLSFQSNHFGFNLTGVAGQTAIVETSTNLQTWTVLATNLLTTASLYFTDPGPLNSPQRFYRLRLQ
ncbi:MAG: hypothetical protein C5B50_29385 [Verrucomicrobia bacterium]|nr:MAG: hypothetical protein C5B50_29385 [Verrucomicrobiota bacterium]